MEGLSQYGCSNGQILVHFERMLNGLANVFISKAEVRAGCGQEAPEPMEVPLFKLKPVQIKVFQTQALDQGSVGPGGARGPRAGLMRESLHRSLSSHHAR